MRWNKVGVISLLVFFLLLASCAPAPGPSSSVWDTILEIGSLGFLCERSWFGLGPCNYQQDTVALMRVLLGILVFALLYMGTSAVPGLKENRNVSITVSIILAIMSVIFIPASILIGIGSAYATLFAVIIIGAPIVGIFFLYRMLDEEKVWLKLILLVLLLLILSAIKSTSEGLISEKVPLEGLAATILGLVDWGRGIVIFMMVWELFKAFRGSGSAATLDGAGKNFWKAVKARMPGTAANARRVQKRELNDYILEEQEEKILDDLKGEALTILADLQAIASRGAIDEAYKTNLVKMILDFGTNLTKAKGTFRNLSKRTTRSNKALDNMFNYFKKKGIRVPQEVKALEYNILKLHQQTFQEIAGIDALYGKIMNSAAMAELEAMTSEMFADENYRITTNSEPFNLTHVHALIKGFQDEKFLLEDAYKRQAEAKKEMTGIIQETRGLYE